MKKCRQGLGRLGRDMIVPSRLSSRPHPPHAPPAPPLSLPGSFNTQLKCLEHPEKLVWIIDDAREGRPHRAPLVWIIGDATAREG